MPINPEIGFIPSVSIGGEDSEDLLTQESLDNLGLGSRTELAPGFIYAESQPEYMGLLPMRTELSVLPLPEDYNPPQVTHYEGSYSFSRDELTPQPEPGQVIVTGSSGIPQWGPIPNHLLSDPQGGMLHINQGSIAENDIRFRIASGQEVIRIADNGDVFIHGNKVDNDHEIYQNMRKFLGMSYSLPVPDPRPRWSPFDQDLLAKDWEETQTLKGDLVV
jgi:hypothetical protein